jgi:hypothetical protein
MKVSEFLISFFGVQAGTIEAKINTKASTAHTLSQ